MDTDLKADFKVKVGQFEGPLELLLDLIEKRKLHISDVSLSGVADEFIEYIKSFEEFPVADSTLNPFSKGSSDHKHKYVSDIADFILVASTLLLIKSKSLLPNLPLSEEEEGDIHNLETRLATYKKHKERAAKLQKMFGNFLHFAKPARLASESIAGREKIFSPTEEITLFSLRDSLKEMLKNMPKKEEDMPKVVVENIISLEEMIDRLSQKIEKSMRTSFSDFSGMGRAEKVNVIVSFLAMLELVKQGLIRVNQNNHFEDIVIEGEKTGVPAYY